MIVDSNIVLRYLLDEASEETIKIFEQPTDTIYIPDLVIFEVIYVLIGPSYNRSKLAVCSALAGLLASPKIVHQSFSDNAYIELYAKTGLDLVI
jgi:predicted nucleic-acid-binding protein